MNTKNERQRRPDSAPTEEHRAEGLDRFGLVHLVICLAIGVAVVVAINLLGWLA